jgi:hypothetical protein
MPSDQIAGLRKKEWPELSLWPFAFGAFTNRNYFFDNAIASLANFAKRREQTVRA